MNKLIDKLFEKDVVVRVFSVLIAILIWFLVMDSDNPFEERTISVPLSNNLDVLESNNLKVVNSNIPITIDVRIKGRRQRISKVTPNEFKALVDLSSITDSGLQSVRIKPPQYTGNQDIIISGFSPATVTMRIERIVGKQYPVVVEYSNLPEGYEVVNLTVDPKTIPLEDIEGTISKVSKVGVQINLANLKSTKELVIRASVVDTEGKALRQFESKYPVLISFDLAKTLPVVTGTKGSPKEGYYFKEIRLSSSTTRVVGSRELLDNLSKITAEPIDISGKSETFETELKLILPKDSSLVKEDGAIKAEVVLDKLATRDLAIPASQITIYDSDTSGAKTYSIDQNTIPITVKGKPDQLQTLRAADIRATISVKGLGAGEHTVPLVVFLPGGITQVGEASVKVVITGTADIEATQTATPNSSPATSASPTVTTSPTPTQ